ncbi:MAG: hypothetical protein M3N68_08735 [Actinomycetota bacterium]|nr:hypothetical protein [Actinomycetota bacterium]
MLRARNRFVQGYNAQAAVSEDQVIVAAEVTNAANGSTMFVPLVAATEANLDAAGRAEAVGAYAADAGYWSVPNATLATDAEILIGPMPATQGITDPDDPRIRSAMKCWRALRRVSSRFGRPPPRWRWIRPGCPRGR